MKRASASAALVLTAFFAVLGSYHHHELPTAPHDHAGLCSAEVEFALESCALCPVVKAAIDLATASGAPPAVDLATHSAVGAASDLESATAGLHREPRAPPSV